MARPMVLTTLGLAAALFLSGACARSPRKPTAVEQPAPVAKPAEPKVPDTQPSPAVQPGGEKEVEAPGGSAPSDTTNFPADTTTAGTYPGSGGSGTDPYSNNNTNSGTGYNNGQNTPPNTGSGSGTGTGTGTGVGTDISKWDGLSFLGNAQWDIQAVP